MDELELPPELWVQIFNNVESPKDLLNCWNATSFWNKALRSTDFYFKLTLPFVLPYLSKREMLRVSSVSKSWNAAVDACVCIQIAEDIEDSDLRSNPDPRSGCKLQSNPMLAFIERFNLSDEPGVKTVAVNPIAFRSVTFELAMYTFKNQWDGQREQIKLNVETLATVQNNLIKCLDHHGHLIRYLEVKISAEIANLFDRMELIRCCLERTPNLRALLLSLAPYSPEYDRTQQTLTNSEQPWPELKDLKVLRFNLHTNREEYAPLANAYAPQITHLQFGFELLKPHRPLTNRFSCVTKIVYFLHESISAMEFGEFVQSCQCPLKNLTVRFSAPMTDDLGDDTYNGVTIAANAASATLKTLFFRSQPVPGKELNFNLTKFMGLRLPKLESMELHAFGYPSVEFLSSVCPALKSLFVIPLFPKYVCSEMVNAGEMYSNLYSHHQFWNQLADVEIVDVDVDYYKVDSKIIFDGGRRRNRRVKIGKKVRGGIRRIIYTRREYKVKVKSGPEPEYV